MNPRSTIVDDFARWTALSALRSGSGHPKAREAVYAALKRVKFGTLFDPSRPPIEEKEFAQWHHASVRKLGRDGFCVGWAAKMINVYLKTRVYVGREGRVGLAKLIHPPIDNGLWKGIALEDDYAAVRSLMHPIENGKRVNAISGITRYETYGKIIDGCRHLANRRGWSLIEVESLWLQQ